MRSKQTDLAQWERLAQLVRRVETGGLQRLPVRELEELGSLYRQASAALARARTRQRDQKLVEYLNQLVARAHGSVYGRRNQPHLNLGYFFAIDLPRTFRAHLDAILLAVILFAFFSMMSYTLVTSDERWAQLLSPMAAEAAQSFIETGEPAGEYFGEIARTLGYGNLAGLILSNNVRAALAAFALGVTLGLGTIVVIFLNALMMGVFFGVGANQGALLDMIAVVAPHGVLEICAFMIAAGAGLVMGASLAAPGDLTRAQALIQGAKEAVKLVLGTVPLLVAAALVEGLLSPQSTGLFADNYARLLFGLALAALGLTYLFLGDFFLGFLVRHRPHSKTGP